MYNGIGLQTARGSGTNGYVQRNLSFIRKHKDRVDYKSEEELKKLDQQLIKQPNKEILDHERKRKVELKCMEMQELMEEQGYSEEEIEQKVTMFRTMLMNKEGVSETSAVDKDETGRPIAKETHQIAEATAEKNARIKEAFGISEHYVDGSSFDPNRKAKEEEAKAIAMAQKKYAILRESSSSERSPSPPPKKKKKKSRAESRSPSRKEKKKKSKKHRHDRSKSKKQRSSSSHKKRRSHEKKRRRRRRRSPSSGSDSSEDSHSSGDSSSDDERNNNKSTTQQGMLSTSPKDQISGLMEKSEVKEKSQTPASRRSRSASSESCKSASNQSEKQGREDDSFGELTTQTTLESPKIQLKAEQTVSKEKLNESAKTNGTKSISPTYTSSDMKERVSITRERPKSPTVRRSRSPSHSRSRSRSRSYSRSRRKRHSKSYSRSKSRSWARSRSRSRKRSYSRSLSRSLSRNRESRSPSIRRRKGSPSHLDRRRITSARKRPVPYYRPTPPSPSSDSSYDSDYRYKRSRSRSRQRYRSGSHGYHTRHNR